MRLEVRCCCNPDLVMGSLPVPVNATVRVGLRVKFVVPPAILLFGRDASTVRVEIPIWLEVGAVVTYQPDGHSEHLAYKSDDLPVALLSRLPGWLGPAVPIIDNVDVIDTADAL